MKRNWAGRMAATLVGLALLAGCSRNAENAAVPAEPAAETPNGKAPETAAPRTGEALRERETAAPDRRTTAPAPPRVTAAPEPVTVTVPEGTPLRVRTTNTLSTAVQQTGDTFTATLEQPLTHNGRTLAPRGAVVEGRIAEADRGGRVEGRAQLAVRLTRLRLASGREAEITTNTFAAEAKSGVKKDAAKVGIGAGIGAAIGAIAGGGKGAAIGAATGAGAGTGVVLATRGAAAEIPSETILDFELRAPLRVALP